jgi:heme a synthase
MFERLSLLTVLAIYFLILVGGIVRSTGSGMGCPDWPKCFGSFIPPTHESQLPDDYKEIYSQKRQQKNERFASMLQSMGMHKAAHDILEDKSILEEQDFNATKTWTEYINRLIGAIIGLLILVTATFSLKYLKSKPVITTVSVLALIAVVFQAWIGSIVVSTNLMPWLISVHMVIALIIVLMLIYVHYKSRHIKSRVLQYKGSNLVKVVLIICMTLLLMQIILGTQVREAVDTIASKMNYENRSEWVEMLGINFLIHRSFSLLLLFTHGLLIYLHFRSGVQDVVYRYVFVAVGAIVLLEIFSGVVLAYLALPAFVQPIHLLLGTVLFGLLFYAYLITNSSKDFPLSNKTQNDFNNH